jgi:hypothetical protein
VHGLIDRDPGSLQRVADIAGRRQELAVAQARCKRLARAELRRRVGEEDSETQAPRRRETENWGGWRSDCATTQ